MLAQNTPSEDVQNIRNANLLRVIYLGACLMTLFIAYSSGQNLAGQIYIQLGYGSLGQVCLLTAWGTFTLASTIASRFVKKVSAKIGMIMGSLAHSSFIIAGALTTFCSKYSYEDGVCSSSFIYCFNIFCAFCVGAGAGYLWLSQATYIDACADQQTKGFYNGLFWSIFQTSQILSSSLATYILGRTDQFTFYLILSGFGMLSVAMLFFIKPPVAYEAKTTIKEEPEQTIGEALESFKKLALDPQYRFFFIGIFFSGAAIATYITFIGSATRLTIESVSINEINEKIGYVLMVLAIGEMAAGLSVGRFADMYDKLMVFKATMMLNEIAAGLTVLACLFGSYTFALMAGFMWGYGENAIQTMINALIGSMFEGRTELFSAYRCFQCAGFVYSTIFCIILANNAPLAFILFIAGSLLGLHILYDRNLLRRNEQAEHNLLGDKSNYVELDRY